MILCEQSRLHSLYTEAVRPTCQSSPEQDTPDIKTRPKVQIQNRDSLRLMLSRLKILRLAGPFRPPLALALPNGQLGYLT